MLLAKSGLVVLVGAFPLCFSFTSPDAVFEIQVLDDQTNRGVPLVELETVNHVRFVTDSAGRVAFHEPGLMNREVFFHVRSHGYAFAKDGFAYAGTSLTPKPGERTVLKIKRLNVAERLYRITGQGLYRDSVLLGQKSPIDEPLLNASVMGQDSTQAVVYRGSIHWFWGDTLVVRYPLGNFRTSGATSELPARGGLDPAFGVNLRYFMDEKGVTRPMCPLEKNSGVVWIDGLITVPDEQGQERMIVHYARMKSLGEMLEQGIAIWNDERQLFERAPQLDLGERWRFPHGHPFRLRDGGADYIYSGNPFPTVRVPAKLKTVLDPAAYEAWTCVDAENAVPKRDPARKLLYAWRSGAVPVTSALERRWLKEGRIKPEEAILQPNDAESGKTVQIHGGSVRWNSHRQRWVMIAVESGGSSLLGEVWYAEARELIGPWRRARKIVTHDKYSFYNPVQHDFFDQDGGRFVFFEGTYTNTFSGNADATPRYDYNQIMYRLDLDDTRLKDVRE